MLSRPHLLEYAGAVPDVEKFTVPPDAGRPGKLIEPGALPALVIPLVRDRAGKERAEPDHVLWFLGIRIHHAPPAFPTSEHTNPSPFFSGIALFGNLGEVAV